jgi:hypothetical protein
MSDVIPTQRVRVVADAVVSAYINEIAAPAPRRPVDRPPEARPRDALARAHARRARRHPLPVARRALELA